MFSMIQWPPRLNLGLTFLMIGFAGTVSAAERPNVLLLVCDDLNCDIGCYGHADVQTPHLDALAARGVRFSQAHCQYPLCGPSRASFLTGLYPDQTGVHRNAVYIRETLPKITTLPQCFRGAGYVATRVGKMYHYQVPMHIGTSGHDDPDSWDFTFNPRGHDREIHDRIHTLTPGQFGGTLSWFADDQPDEAQTDGIAAQIATDLLQEYAQSEQPFFLAVGLYRPHTPYVAPQNYFDLYPAESIVVPTVPRGYLTTIPKPAAATLTKKRDQRSMAPEVARQAIQGYRASITFADAQLGKILQALAATGLQDNTIVAFTSDHGYHMGEHGYYQKQTLYQNATHVPLMIAGPGVPTGGVSRAATELVDLYPTLTALAGVKTPGHCKGVDLIASLGDADGEGQRAALTQLHDGYALTDSRYRIVLWGPDGRDGIEFYDRQSDPGEMTNLADKPEHQAKLQQWRSRLNDRIEKVGGPRS